MRSPVKSAGGAPALPLLALVLGLLLALSLAEAKIAYHESFDSLDQWVVSKHLTNYGIVALSPGRIFVDKEKETGLQLTQDAHFYAVTKKLPTPVTNDGTDFVVSFSLKNEQNLRCGGGYIKLLSEVDQQDFHGDSHYWLMFGPDRCGSTNRIHIIFNHKGKNHLWKKVISWPDDHLTHVYTLHVGSDNTYVLYVDAAEKEKGKLEEDWDFLGPKTIPDPSDKKPKDWVDEARIPDPTDTKPDDWDDEPAVITDESATKPEDWDDSEDGEWAPPEIPNPKYKGKWAPRMIDNPNYKGPWVQKTIPNPKYKEDPTLYKIPKPLAYVGIDVWQVEAGSIFNNIIIGDNIEEVLELVKSTYGAMAEKEKAAVAKAEEEASADATPEAEITIPTQDSSSAEEVDEGEEDL